MKRSRNRLIAGGLSLALVATPVALLAAAAVAEAQATATHDASAAAKGAIVYGRYCISCHGKGARGDGPLAADLRVAVPDMTTLAARNAGRFPEERVRRIIESGEVLRGHGTPDMPAWGDAFKRTEGTEAATPQQAIRNLTQYLASLQR
jgi:mono/diheme cytochrome c family protein